MKINDIKSASSVVFKQRVLSISSVKIFMVILRRDVYGNHVCRYRTARFEYQDTSFHSNSISARDFAESSRKQGLYFSIHELPALAIKAEKSTLIVSQINMPTDKILRGYSPDRNLFLNGNLNDISESFLEFSPYWCNNYNPSERIIKLLCDSSIDLISIKGDQNMETFDSTAPQRGGALCWNLRPEFGKAETIYKLAIEINNYFLDRPVFKNGYIYWYDRSKRYGFIKMDSKKVFFHISSVIKKKDKINKGVRVKFQLKYNYKGEEAAEIEIL